MGKRSKEKRLAETAGRRKQTIQLEGLSRHQQTPLYNTDNYRYPDYTSTKPSRVSGIQLLGSYQEGSDDDSGTEGPIPMSDQNLSLPKKMESENKMDVELAGFLAEINAIDTTSASTQESKELSDAAVYDPLNFDPYTQGSLLPAPWQAVLDENSGYHYYWNCETNEVQWEPPPAPVVQGCPLPEAPPPPLTVDSINQSNSGMEQDQEPHLETQRLVEEEQPRKAMSTKLAGLSKKERIKLLLEMNKMNVEEIPTESDEKRENGMSENREKSSKEIVEGVIDSSIDECSEKGKSINEQIQKPILGLVSGYDSEASEGDDNSESVDKDNSMAIVKEDLPVNVEDYRTISLDRNSYSGSQLRDSQALCEDRDDLTVCKVEQEVGSEADKMEIADGEKDMASSNSSMEIMQESVSGVTQDDEKDKDFLVTSELIKEVDGKESEKEGGTNRLEGGSESIEELSSKKNFNVEKTNLGIASDDKNSKEGSTDTDRKMKDTSVATESYIEKSEEKTKKEFSVDIFADESDHEHDVESVTAKKADGGGKTGEEVCPQLEDNSKDTNHVIDEEKSGGLVEDAKENEHKQKDPDRKKRSKHKERKKGKKEKKDKKRKDHDRKHKDSEKKRKDDKSNRKSKRHSEKRHESSKLPRTSKEEDNENRKSKKEDELTEKEKLEIEEEKRKGILKEIEKEERRRSEYERLKKEEKEREEEEQRILETEKRKQEEKKKKEEILKEEEMHDFAEMLLEGALDGEKPSAKAELENKIELLVEDDMEISDVEESEGNPPLPPMPPPDDRPTFKEQAWPNDNQDEKYYEEMQTKINDLSLLLFDKLEFLEVSKKGLTNFQVMFIALETRMHDWREGALSHEYLLYKLEEIDAEICKYEETASPDGWSCHWSSDHGMYYYYCEDTGESTWSYPVDKGPEDKTHASRVTYGSAYHATTGTETPPAPLAAPSDNYGYGQSNMMVWQSDLVENEMKEEKRTNKKKITKSDPYRDPYRHSISKKDETKPLSAVIEPPLPPGEDDNNLSNLLDDDKRSGTSSPFPLAMTNASSIPAVSAVTSVVAAPVAVATFTAVPIAEMSNTVMQQSDVQVLNEESSDAIVVKDASTLPGIPRVASDSALVGSHSLQAIPSASIMQSSVQPKTEKKKKEKRKKLVAGGLPSKKLKSVSTLVQKWQQVKQKADEEFKEDSSEDEDPIVLSQKRIEEWKKAQLESGRAAYNPNFEEVKGDWRDKIKKKHQ